MTIPTDDAASAAPSAPARVKFDGLTILLHWITVLMVLWQFASALAIDRVAPEDARLWLQLHRSSGVVLWAVVAFRLAWRFTGMRLPPLPANRARWHILGVHLSEYGLYALLLVQPVTGLAETMLRGRPFPLFGVTVPALLARDRTLAEAAHSLHELGAWTLLALAGVHALAALVHHLILKDRVQVAMLPGRATR